MDLLKIARQVVQIAEEAGRIILEVYDSEDLGVEEKSDASPVTEADRRADAFIRQRLSDQFAFPIVSEETAVDDAERQSWSTFWLVDPLDGTKNFIAKDGEFTVNIALVRDHEPVIGVVCIPVGDISYFAARDEGAFRKTPEGEERIENRRTETDLVCAVSKFHNSASTEEFCAKHGITKTAGYGSSLKLCKLAEGEIDVYPRLAPTKEWDIAAAHCVVNEAGGKVVEYESGRPLRYNKGSILNPFFVASRRDLDFGSGG